MMSKEGFFWKKDCKLQWLPRTIYRFFLKRFFNINSVKKGGRSRKWIVVSFRWAFVVYLSYLQQYSKLLLCDANTDGRVDDNDDFNVGGPNVAYRV